MIKIKNKQFKNNNSLNYYQFLNQYNFEKTNKFKHILFENPILIQKKKNNILNLNEKETISVPNNSIQNLDTLLYSIESQYKNHLLFNYNFQYNLLYHFSKIFLKQKFKNKIINGRILKNTKNKKNVLISIFGLIFYMKLKQLHNNRKFFWKQKLKFKYIRIVNSYKLRNLNFKINNNQYQKNNLSRKKYVQEIYLNKKKKKNASI